jgi:hypothetical protein
MIGDYYRYVARSAKLASLKEVKNVDHEGYRQAEQLS